MTADPDSDTLDTAAAMNLSHHHKIKTTDVRNNFGAIVDQVAIAKEPVLLTRRGRYLAAIIPMEEFRILERVIQKAEDEMDLEFARRYKEEPKDWIPYERIRKELGLDEDDRPVHAKRRKAAAAAAKGHSKARGQAVVKPRLGAKSGRRRKA